MRGQQLRTGIPLATVQLWVHMLHPPRQRMAQQQCRQQQGAARCCRSGTLVSDGTAAVGQQHLAAAAVARCPAGKREIRIMMSSFGMLECVQVSSEYVQEKSSESWTEKSGRVKHLLSM